MPYGINANELMPGSTSVADGAWDEVNAPFGAGSRCWPATLACRWWLVRKAINGLEDFKGLRAGCGLGAEVLRRMGAIVMGIPGGEIVGALKSGAIDASE